MFCCTMYVIMNYTNKTMTYILWPIVFILHSYTHIAHIYAMYSVRIEAA